MSGAKQAAQYTLAEDVDIAGMVWRKGASVFTRDVAKSEGTRMDVFLTHKKEYAKRGSHAPVTRLPVACVVIDGDTVKILEAEEQAADEAED